MLTMRQSAIRIDVNRLRSKAKTILFCFLLFFFIWDVNFAFIPFTSNTHLAIFGLLLFPFTFPFKLHKEDIAPIFIYIAMLVYAALIVVIHRTSDYEFIISELIRFLIVPFFGAWLLAYVGKTIISSKEKLMECIVLVNLIQSVFIILEFTVPVFKKAILSIQVLTANGVGAMVEQGIRAYGLGAGYDIGAFTMAFSLLITIYLYFEDNVQKKKVRYLLYFIVQVLAGLLMARSIFFGCIVSVLFFLCINGPNMGKKKRRIIGIILALGIVVFIVLSIFGSKLSQLTKEYSKTLTWIFEFFIWDKVKATGKQTNSLMVLMSMYSLPQKISIWLFGEGRYVTASGNPYKDMDPFYMRFLYFWGISGIAVYLVFLKELITNIKKKFKRCIGICESGKNEKLFCLFLSFMFIMCLVIDLKLIAHCFGLLFLFMWFFYLKEHQNSKKLSAQRNAESESI